MKDHRSQDEVLWSDAASLMIPLLRKWQSQFTLLAFLFSQLFGLQFCCLWYLLVSLVTFAKQADKINTSLKKKLF